MSSPHPDRLPAPEPGERRPYEADPATLIGNIREAFLYHRWVVTHPNPQGGNDG